MNTALTPQPMTLPSQRSTETAAVISMIAQAARDPSVDIDKLERLILMRERMEAKAAEAAFNEAMTAAQSEMRAVAADSANPSTKSKYASYFALDRAVRPIYTAHGFALSFNTGDGAPDNCVRILCDVSCGGHTRRYHFDMPADGMGAKGGAVMTRTHAAGSAATYGRRYLLLMIFNIAIGNDATDDDGNGAAGGRGQGTITDEQARDISLLITETKSDLTKFIKFFKIETLPELPAQRFAQAVAMLDAKRRQA